MPRSAWRGAITFGLVHDLGLPEKVAVKSATRERKPARRAAKKAGHHAERRA